MGFEAPLEVVEVIIAKSSNENGQSFLSKDIIGELLEDKVVIEEFDDIPVEESHTQQDVVVETEEIIRRDESKIQQIGAIKIIKNPDFDSVGSAGTVDDFLSLFSDRFNRIKRIYMARIDTQGAISPKFAKERRHNARQQKALAREGGRPQRPASQLVIGIVKSKRVSKSRNVIIELEDKEDTLLCVIPSSSRGLKGTELLTKGNSLLLDEVVCVSGYVSQDGIMIADDVIFPDIPHARESGRASRNVYAAFISDIHCGSEEFLEDEFEAFIAWLGGKDVDSEEKEWNKQVEYLFLAGDLVDGIGVYPRQQDNLTIPDLCDQYSYFATKLRKLPSHITTVIIPGNHDACRQALPKPPIPESFAGALYDLGDKVLMMGDSCHVQVEGVDIVLTHGDSMDDLVVNTPGASYKEPAVGMKELLRKRHLAPLYGNKTELAPLHRDWMVIEKPPDIVHFGHAHHNAVDNYRGVQIINSGTFQGQTDFMRKQGILPTPGIVTFVNLRTGAPNVKFFYDLSKIEGNGRN
jgi:DNA polymerase II small subunit